MISIEDLIGMSELTRGEVEAIAEHFHLPDALACEIGARLADEPGGFNKIRDIILETLHEAEARDDTAHAEELRLVLKRFCLDHPSTH